MREGLIPQNIDHMGLAKPLREHLDVLDGCISIQEGIGGNNGRLELVHEDLGLRGRRIRINQTNDFFIGLKSKGPKQDEQG